MSRLLLNTPFAILPLVVVNSAPGQQCPTHLNSPPLVYLSGPSSNSPPTFCWGSQPGSGCSGGSGSFSQSGTLQPGTYSFEVEGVAKNNYGCDEIVSASVQLTLSSGVSIQPSTFRIATEAPSAYDAGASTGYFYGGGGILFRASHTESAPAPAQPVGFGGVSFSVDTIGPVSSQTGWSIDGWGRTQTGFSNAALGLFHSVDNFTVTAPTDYTVNATTNSCTGYGGSPCAGLSQDVPYLANSGGCGSGCVFEFVLGGGLSGWFDPPLAHGYAFTATGQAKFTQIVNFPFGIDKDGQFIIRTGGQTLGTFTVGQSVDFVALTGAAVASFELLGLDPMVDDTSQIAFPIELAFDSVPSAFSMAPIDMIPPSPFCFGDGTGGTCPCNNTGSTGRGCDNMQPRGTGGASLGGFGVASIAADTLTLYVADTLNHIHILFEGTSNPAPVRSGAGLRCVGGGSNGSGQSFLKRLKKGTPPFGEIFFTDISATSASRGAPLNVAETYYYYAAYRDTEMNGARGCSGLAYGFNASNALAVTWSL